MSPWEMPTSDITRNKTMSPAPGGHCNTFSLLGHIGPAIWFESLTHETSQFTFRTLEHHDHAFCLFQINRFKS